MLAHEGSWSADRRDLDGNVLTHTDHEAMLGLARRFLDEILSAVNEFAETHTPGFQEVALHASYWLIELEAQRKGVSPS